MSIWVDADACPKVCRDILLRAGERLQIALHFVSNHPLPLPRANWCRQYQVAAGFDVADNLIAGRVSAGDLVITQDIPLAACCVDKGALVITPRGDKLDSDNVKARLAVRNLQEELRSAGLVSGGPPAIDQKDRQKFGNALDQYLQHWQKRPR